MARTVRLACSESSSLWQGFREDRSGNVLLYVSIGTAAKTTPKKPKSPGVVHLEIAGMACRLRPRHSSLELSDTVVAAARGCGCSTQGWRAECCRVSDQQKA